MKKSTFKRALTLVLCLAIFIASVPFAAVSAATPSNVIIDNFDGAENWESETGEASYLMSRFNPPNTNLHNGGAIQIFTHKDWPNDRRVVSVEGTYLNSYWGSLFVYDYKDENNFRGFYMQKATNQNFYWVIKETDKNNPDKVYFYKSAASEAYFWTNLIVAGELSTFKLDYKEDNTITFTHVGYDDTTLTNTQVLPTGDFTVADNKLSYLKVSTDGGETFEAATETHTFAGIEDVRECEFAIGSGSNDNYLDNLTITFEKTAAEYVSDFRTNHAAVLAKTTATVTDADKDAIAAALAEYETLTNEAKELLTAEKTLLEALGDKVISAQFDADSFTDDFSGENYWVQVGDGANGSISNEAFYPGAPTDLVNGKTSVHAHKYWPERAINSVSGVLKLVYHSPAIIYYYKDANNWRGFFFQVGSNAHGRYIMKESDPNDPNKVYYYYSQTNNKHGFLANPSDSLVNFDITYDSNSSITLNATIYKGTENEATKTATFGGQETVAAEKLMVSTDGGKTFSAATEGYTFKALTDAKSSQFAMGYTANSGGYFDNLTFNFDKSDADVAAEYKATHATILAKTLDTVLAGDEAAIKTALEAYDALSSGAKALLADEKALLDALEQKVVVEKFNVDSFTDDFSGDNNWVQVGSGDEGTIVSGEYYPGASTNLTGNISIHTHKYWPTRQLKKVSGSYRTAALSSLVIYYYKDANNWRGFYSHNGSQRHARFVMKATDTATGNVYFWYSNSNDIASIATTTNNPMAFELIYEDDSTIKLRLDGQERLDTISNARTSRDGQTFVSTDGGQTFSAISGTYTFPAITDAKSAKFAMGNGQNSSRFDNLTFEFSAPYDPSVSEEFEAFEETYTDTTSAVDYNDLAAINEALTLYETLTPEQQANYATEKAALEALKSVAEFDKGIRDIAVTPANINTAAEKQAEYAAMGIDNASIESAIASVEAKVNTFRATVQGASIKGDADPAKQDLRFEYKAPTGSANGWYVKEYGAIFLPESMLSTVELSVENVKNGTAAGGGNTLTQGQSVPSTFYANLTNSAINQLRCETNIAGTAYIIWTNGTDEYVYYCNNDVNNDGYTTENTDDGIGVRSVYGVARKIAKAIYGTTEYGTVNYTEAVTAGGDVATFADNDILAFVAANLEVITNYVAAKQ